MSYSNVGGSDGQPKVFQATTSTTQAPGGVRETRKMVRDSTSGLEKVAVGHHIGERGHVIERQRNRRTGDQEENQEFINLDEGQGLCLIQLCIYKPFFFSNCRCTTVQKPSLYMLHR